MYFTDHKKHHANLVRHFQLWFLNWLNPVGHEQNHHYLLPNPEKNKHFNKETERKEKTIKESFKTYLFWRSSYWKQSDSGSCWSDVISLEIHRFHQGEGLCDRLVWLRGQILMNHYALWLLYLSLHSFVLLTSGFQAAVESPLRCVQQLPGRLPKLTVTAGQVKGCHGCRAELLQQGEN